MDQHHRLDNLSLAVRETLVLKLTPYQIVFIKYAHKTL